MQHVNNPNNIPSTNNPIKGSKSVGVSKHRRLPMHTQNLTKSKVMLYVHERKV